LEVPKKWTERIGRRLKLSGPPPYYYGVEMGQHGESAEQLAISAGLLYQSYCHLEHTIGVAC